MKSRKLLFFILACSIVLIGCNKEKIGYVDPEKNLTVNYASVFDAFWNGVDRNYLYWDVDRDKVNWDEVRSRYAPLFAKLNINNKQDLIKGREYLSLMTKDLSDGHFRITFSSPLIEMDTISPALVRFKSRAETTISDNILYGKNLRDFLSEASLYTDPSTNLRLLTGKISSSSIYIHYNYCFLREGYQSNVNIKKIIDQFFTSAASSLVTTIVIDLRNNSGGDVSDLNFFIGSFFSDQTAFGYLKYKQGINRLDYTPNLDAMVIPVKQIGLAQKKIIVILNGRSASMAEISALALSANPNTTIIGQQSFGALGMIAFQRSLYNAGSFNVGEFMQVRMSSASLSDKNRDNFEGKGILPAKNIKLVDTEKDNQLEYAIGMIGK